MLLKKQKKYSENDQVQGLKTSGGKNPESEQNYYCSRSLQKIYKKVWLLGSQNIKK